MALTELQLPEKAKFYANIQTAASNLFNLMQRWENLASFIDKVKTADLDAMGVPTGQIRTDLVEFRTVLNEVTAFFNGTSTTQTEVPLDVIEKLRSM